MEQTSKMLILFILITIPALTISQTVYEAIAILSPTSSTSDQISGHVRFSYDAGTATIGVEVVLSGIDTNSNGQHGIHVHAFGDLRGLDITSGANMTGGLSTGGHFNPFSSSHGCPDGGGSTSWHAGDMGNWQATAGVISQTKTFTNQMSLVKGDPNSIIGRAVVVHATTDDCANVPSAGGRLAVGVIGISSVSSPKVNAAGPSTDLPSSKNAICVFQGTANCTNGYCQIGKIGMALLENNETGVRVRARIYQLFTERGFHIHEFGDLTNPLGNSAGSHYNPRQNSHGLPPSDARHLGDFGRISMFVNSNAYYDYVSILSGISWNVSDVIGRAIVVHQDVDHGNEPTCANSAATGAAGARIYWCVIGMANNATQVPPENFLPIPDVPTYLTLPQKWDNIPCSTQPSIGSLIFPKWNIIFSMISFLGIGQFLLYNSM